ncbi:hypothetical protein [Streptomyces sediminimaris]|uniref:hypothetical protein n=1 Tax=Streptomyces sediminimaris TaxID=3383721 RepID=UPI00399A3D1F
MRQHPEQSQQPRQERRTPLAARPVRGAVLVAGLALLPLSTACGSEADDAAVDGDPSQISGAPAAGVVAPAKVEVIAALTGCKVKIRTEAKELREGICHTKEGDYLITTFPEERYKKSWLDTVSMYRGNYLVGSRWVVSAPPKALKAFRPKLGGEIVRMSGTGPGVTQSPS